MALDYGMGQGLSMELIILKSSLFAVIAI